MSQKPGQPQSARKVSTNPPARQPDSQEYEEDYYEPEPQPRPQAQSQAQAPARPQAQQLPRKQPPPPNAPQSTRTTYTASGRSAGSARGGGSSARPRSVQPKPDRFPYIIGALIGLAVAGLLAVAYLLGTSSKGTPGTSALQPSTTAPVVAVTSVAAVPTAEGTPAPRMPVEQFKALYDDPAKRPLIIDVRAKDNFDAGHIKGAISFPESDVDTRVAELPKNKLIVAYCQ